MAVFRLFCLNQGGPGLNCLRARSSNVKNLTDNPVNKPGGTPHVKGVGMLVGNLELNP